MLRNVPWRLYEELSAARGESARPKMSYIDGTLELVTPSYDHDAISRMIDKLLFVWADESDTPLISAGSWTQGRRASKAGLEPDESYALGRRRPKRPDVALEVLWTEVGTSKLEIYRRLGIPEVWLWRDDQISVHVLGPKGYERKTRSRLLPGLDLRLLARFVRREDQLEALREYRAALRRH
ncbi:MAG: Uma2 family endonuclease [Myxococcaceae bacterium]